MMYVAWIALIVVGLGASFWAFAWALRTGQFVEQERARFLPLRGEMPQTPGVHPTKLPAEVYFLLVVLGLGLLALGTAILLALWGPKG